MRACVRACVCAVFVCGARELEPFNGPFLNISIRPPPSLSPFLRAATPRPAPRPSPSSAPHRPTRGASPARAAGLLAATDITACNRHHGLQQTSRPATDISRSWVRIGIVPLAGPGGGQQRLPDAMHHTSRALLVCYPPPVHARTQGETRVIARLPDRPSPSPVSCHHEPAAVRALRSRRLEARRVWGRPLRRFASHGCERLAGESRGTGCVVAAGPGACAVRWRRTFCFDWAAQSGCKRGV